MNEDAKSPGLRLQRHPEGIAELAISRPAVRNALDEATALGLCDGLYEVGKDPGIGCVLLSGEGVAFCAGADIGEFAAGPAQPASERLARLFEPALKAIMTMDKPVIAAVEGAAAGIGVSYVLASDLVVMSESAYLKLAFIDIGLIPDGGACWHLMQRLGHARAFEMAALATPLPASRCEALGLANRVVAEGQAREAGLELARRLIAQPAQALTATKQALRAAGELSLEATMALEGRLQDACKAAPDFQDRLQAFHRRR